MANCNGFGVDPPDYSSFFLLFPLRADHSVQSANFQEVVSKDLVFEERLVSKNRSDLILEKAIDKS